MRNSQRFSFSQAAQKDKQDIIQLLSEYCLTREHPTISMRISMWIFHNPLLRDRKIQFAKDLIEKIESLQSLHQIFVLLYCAYSDKLTYTAKDGKDKKCSGNDGRLGRELSAGMDSIIMKLKSEAELNKFINSCQETLKKNNVTVKVPAPSEMTPLLSDTSRGKNLDTIDGDLECFIKIAWDEIQRACKGGLIY